MRCSRTKSSENRTMNIDIYNVLKNRILFLEYKPGQVLNEKLLAEEFGVSRTPLRSVLNRLEWEQLVRVLPRTGTIITEVEFQKSMNTYQVRFGIEELVGNLSAKNVSEEYLARIKTLEEDCSRLFDHRNRRALVDIDLRFRDLLFEAANNPVLKDISNQLYNITLRLWFTTLEQGGWVEEVQAMLDEIVETRRVWESDSLSGFGKFRKKMLMHHLDRIRKNFLGISDITI